MESKIRLYFLVLAATFTLAFSRVLPRRGRQIQHPPVLTRPRSQPSVVRWGNRNPVAYQQQNTTTLTTPEPLDDDLLTTTATSGNFGRGGYFGGGLSYDMYTGGAPGGTSWEYDDDATTTQQSYWFGNRRRQGPSMQQGPSYSVYTTPGPTTTNPEPPEKEEEMPTGSRFGLFGGGSGVGSSGYCFCSPLGSCPAQSIPRGGLCVNVLTLFTRARFIRCCYSPSIAKKRLL